MRNRLDRRNHECVPLSSSRVVDVADTSVAAIPSSSRREQCIRTWCPRSASFLDELSTGDLEMVQMAWTKPQQSLFALGGEEYTGEGWSRNAMHAQTAFGTRWHEEGPAFVV